MNSFYKHQLLTQLHWYLKNGVSKSIADVVKYANFLLYRVYPAGVIWKNRQIMKNL